jgi:glycosyltransferase involved in cell wall biosynthesis
MPRARWYYKYRTRLRRALLFRKGGRHRRIVEESGLFDAHWYRCRYPDVEGLDPLDHYLVHGGAEGRWPNPDFDGAWYLEAYPDVADAGLNPLLHYLLHGITEGRLGRSDAGPLQATPPAQAALLKRLRELWPLIQSDAKALQDVANPITPTPKLLSLWQNSVVHAAAVQTGTVVQQVLTRLPSRTDHLLLVPWLGVSGGSEKVAQRLLTFLRSRYAHGRLAVMAPDAIFDLRPMQRLSYEVPIVALNDIDAQLSASDRAEIVDHVLINLRPRTVHVINSSAGWDALRERADDYARDSNIFVNIYSDLRLRDGAPGSYFWGHLPEVIPHLAGIFADNATVVARAVENFSLVPEQRTLFTVVPTPIVGLDGEDPAAQCRPYAGSARRHTLWMGRIAHEKRLDILRAVAQRLPTRQFSIYGSAIPGSVPPDHLAWTAEMKNVRHMGAFSALGALPLDRFDSYLLTTSAEGMPLTVLEAAMLGLPIVAPAVGGIGEFIDETTGWIVSDAEAVDQFAASLDDISARPVEAGRRVARAQQRLIGRHSWSNFQHVVSDVPNYIVADGAV